MSKGKAQAFDEGFSVTASALASNEKNDEPPVIGYRYSGDEDSSLIELVTLNEFSGDEILLPPGYDRDSLNKLKSSVELNSKRFRKAKRWHWGTLTALVTGGFALTIGTVAISQTLDIDFQWALTCVLTGMAMMLATIPMLYVGEALLKRISRASKKDEMKIEGELKAQQGFTSLISGERFKIESPNHESIHEAVKLLNMAWVVNDTLTALKEGKPNLEYVRKTSEIRRELAELEKSIERLNKDLKAYEAKIEELLLRNDD